MDEDKLETCRRLRRKAAEMRALSTNMAAEAQQIDQMAAEFDDMAEGMNCPPLEDLEDGG